MSDSLVSSLSAALGAEHCVAGDGGLSVPGGRADAVVSPGTTEETAEVLRLAAAAGAVVVPWGGGTRQRMGGPLSPADRPVIALRTTRLNQVLDYTPEDMTISVGAGATMAEFAAAIAPNGQMFPVDVALPGRSTVGGALATAADGPRRLGYGTFRDLFLGVTIVEAGGRVAKAGGMTVKNVSGYDMMKLHLGALGSLGVIVSANFKLLPTPRAAATIACHFDALPGVLAMLDALHASKLVPSACELVSAEGGEGFGLCLMTEGLPQAVERHKRDVPKIAAQSGARDSQILEGDDHAALWARINDLPQAADLAPDELVFRGACLPSEMGATVDGVLAAAKANGATASFTARALNGVGYFRLRGEPAALARAWKSLAQAMPAASFVVIGAGSPEAAPDPWGRLPGGLDVMRRLKREFDPANLLNPGRFLV